MYFLLDACQHPAVLRTIYFGTIIKDIVFTIIPIGIVLMTIIDFSKGVIAGKEDEQQKAVKLIPKRLMYAIIVFAIPWVVHILMKTLSNLKLSVATNYQLCIDNAKSGSENGFKQFDEMLEAEEEEEARELAAARERQISQYQNSNGYGTTYSSLDEVVANNIYQCSGTGRNTPWSNYSLQPSLYDSDVRTICTSACGFCSMAMILRSFGYDATPIDVVETAYAAGKGNHGFCWYSEDYPPVAEKYGLNYKFYYGGDINPKDKFIKTLEPALKEGKRFSVNMVGHYISILGIRSNGTLYVGDSSGSRDYSKKGPYTLGEFYDILVRDGGGNLLNATAFWK